MSTSLTETFVVIGLGAVLAAATAFAGQGVALALSHAVHHWAGAITSIGGL